MCERRRVSAGGGGAAEGCVAVDVSERRREGGRERKK